MPKDITILQNAETGSVTLVIADAPLDERRFRLRETLTNKYLGKRGWTKTAAYLPEDAVEDGERLRIEISAPLANRIARFATLVLEAPSAGYARDLVWRPQSSSALAPEENVTPSPRDSEGGEAAAEAASTAPEVVVERPTATRDDGSIAATNALAAEPADSSAQREAGLAEMLPGAEEHPAIGPKIFISAALAFLLGIGLANMLPGYFGPAHEPETAHAAPAKPETPPAAAAAQDRPSAQLEEKLHRAEERIRQLEEAAAARPKPVSDNMSEKVRRAEEERDLYRQELEKMTASFAALEARNRKLGEILKQSLDNRQ